MKPATHEGALAAAVAWLSAFLPASVHLSQKERARSCLGALIGLALTAGITRAALGPSSDLPLLVAPMGASAVLLFGVPASPLAQPWSLLGGNLVSALIGVSCAIYLGNGSWSAAVAVAVSLGAMFALRCVHPPSGAVALTAVLGGPSITALGYQFVLLPVALNSLALIAVAVAYHGMTRHRYPHRAHKTAPESAAADQQSFTRADLDAVLTERNEVLDIDVDDLQSVLDDVEARVYRRHLKGLDCASVMTADVKSVQPEMPVQAAWQLLQRHKIKALPVIDAQQAVVGILTQMDFFHHWQAVDTLTPVPPLFSTTAGDDMTVREIMTAPVRTALASQPLAELVPLFAHSGHHHLPVVDAHDRLVGMVTQANLVAGLYRHALDDLRTG